jgi:hypothetical protein
VRPHDFLPSDAWLAALFIIGAIAMRGAGCTYNDILDRDIDAKVARTALRPLPSGAVTLKQAWVWLLAQCGVGLAVLLCLPDFAKLVALGAIPMVALYPLMKRITWWPQVWLGLTFNWGALVAAAADAGTDHASRRPALRRADLLDARLRHDLRHSGSRRRRAHRREIDRAPLRRSASSRRHGDLRALHRARGDSPVTSRPGWYGAAATRRSRCI